MLFPPEIMGIEPGARGAPTAGPHVGEEAFRWALPHATASQLSWVEERQAVPTKPTYRSVTIKKKQMLLF